MNDAKSEMCKRIARLVEKHWTGEKIDLMLAELELRRGKGSVDTELYSAIFELGMLHVLDEANIAEKV